MVLREQKVSIEQMMDKYDVVEEGGRGEELPSTSLRRVVEERRFQEETEGGQSGEETEEDEGHGREMCPVKEEVSEDDEEREQEQEDEEGEEETPAVDREEVDDSGDFLKDRFDSRDIAADPSLQEGKSHELSSTTMTALQEEIKEMQRVTDNLSRRLEEVRENRCYHEHRLSRAKAERTSSAVQLLHRQTVVEELRSRVQDCSCSGAADVARVAAGEKVSLSALGIGEDELTAQVEPSHDTVVRQV